jgi:hypothetical protein
MGAVGEMLGYRFGVVIPVLFVIFQGLQERTGTPVATKENDVAL